MPRPRHTRATRLARMQAIGLIYDTDDEERLLAYTWHATAQGYAQATSPYDGEPKTIRAHRVVMRAEKDQREIDHINGNKLDNRKSNLRFADRYVNNANCARVNSAANIEPRNGRFRLCIRRHGFKIDKTFDTFEEARAAKERFLNETDVPPSPGR